MIWEALGVTGKRLQAWLPPNQLHVVYRLQLSPGEMCYEATKVEKATTTGGKIRIADDTQRACLKKTFVKC